MHIDINWDLRWDPKVGTHTDVPSKIRGACESTVQQYLEHAEDCQSYDFLWATVRAAPHGNASGGDERRHLTVEFKDTNMQRNRTQMTAHIVYLSEDKDDFRIDYDVSQLFAERDDKNPSRSDADD